MPARSTTKRSKVAEARHQMYRELILKSAEHVFAQSGYHDARMQDVAGEAGISLQTLYATFPSKRATFEALHEYRGAQFLARVEAPLREDRPARDVLRRAIDAYVRFVSEHLEYFHVDLREGRSWAIGDVEASPTFQAGISRWTELMRHGIREGSFYDEDPEMMAATAFGLIQLQLAIRLERAGTDDLEALSRSIALQVERVLCPPASGRPLR